MSSPASSSPDLIRRNCNEYISYENLFAESVGATEDVSVIQGAYVLLARAINTLNERIMDVRSSSVKQMMMQLNPAFRSAIFRCSQFKQFLDKGVKAGIVKLGGRDLQSGEFMVFLPGDFDDDISEPSVNGKAADSDAEKAHRTRTPHAPPGQESGRHARQGAGNKRNDP